MLKVLKRGKRKMQYQWFVFWSGLFDWLIFSVSLFVIADKLGWQKKRDAWVPGLRIYRLGESVHVNLPMTKVTGLCLPCGQTASCDAFRIRLFA